MAARYDGSQVFTKVYLQKYTLQYSEYSDQQNNFIVYELVASFLPNLSVLVLLHRIQSQWGQSLLTSPTSAVKAI